MTDIFQCLERIGISGEVPKTMGELEAALGVQFVDSDLEKPKKLSMFEPQRALGGDILGLSALYLWDMHHEQLVTTAADLRPRGMVDFTLKLARGRSVIARALYERFGTPRSAGGALVYERWILAHDGRGDTCQLSHYEKLPDWAVSPPDAALRRRILLELVGVAGTADTRDDLERIARDAPPESGIVFKPGSRRGVDMELVPPIAALELVEIFGWQNPVGETDDMHLSTWRLKTIVDQHPHGVVTAPPRHGRWNVYAVFDRCPTGSAVAEAYPPLGGRQRLGPSDVIRSFSFGPY